MIIDNNRGLMFIEPTGTDPRGPIMDELTLKAQEVFDRCDEDVMSATRGWHICTGCNKANSTNVVYNTPKGRVTNSLLAHYVEYHRNEIPAQEMKKLMEEIS